MEDFNWRCPACKGHEFEVLMGKKGPWSMEPCCTACGFIDEDLHYFAVEAREKAAKEKEEKAA